MEHKSPINTDVIVIGGGISGITAALEAAECGMNVTLIEKRPYLGGRVAQLNMYFPKLCPPTCGLEVNFKRLKDNPRVKILTLSEAIDVNGESGNYEVTIKQNPRYVVEGADDQELTNAAEEMATERADEYNYGLSRTKALYLPYNNCFPLEWVFDKSACTEEEILHYRDAFSNVLDLDQKTEYFDYKAKAVIWASGWEPYNAKNMDNLGYGKLPGIITNVELERLASPYGPTKGKIEIPGLDKEIKSVAFVQCAGSRDETHLEYCSSICCLASLKQARYLREQLPNVDIHVFYIDIRAYGIFEDFYTETKKDEKLYLHRGKVAKVIKDPNSDKLIVEAEDTLKASLQQASVDLVVLATGMKPNTANSTVIDKSLLDENGFVRNDIDSGQFGCGTCTRPKDVAGVVQESTAAAIKALHTIMRSK